MFILKIYPLIGLEKHKKDKGVLNEIDVKTSINNLTDKVVFRIFYIINKKIELYIIYFIYI